MSWDAGRPIYGRLPEDSQQYQGNELVDWLTLPWDELLVEARSQADALHANYFDPVTAKVEVLDWLAQLCGFTGDYWEATWPEGVKRELIANSFEFIWPNKGTRELLEWLIELFALQAQVYILGDFLAGITLLPATLGGPGFQYFIRVPLVYLRTTYEWRLMVKLNRLYGPVYCESRVCYDQFYAGFSVAGDPTFDEAIFV